MAATRIPLQNLLFRNCLQCNKVPVCKSSNRAAPAHETPLTTTNSGAGTPPTDQSQFETQNMPLPPPLPTSNGIRYSVCPERTRSHAYPWMETRPQAQMTMAQRMRHMELAPPYPNPVPSVSSQRIADNEKAQKMLLYSHNIFGGSGGKMPPHSRHFCTMVGNDPEKCKKVKANRVKSCPSMTLEGCDPPVKNVGCKREAMQVECSKQKAPYAAYSELCHELPEKTLSECVVCPWKAEDNPNFKPKKRHFHTSAFQRSQNGEMLCDLRKAPCKAPTGNSCEDRKKKEKERSKKEKPGADSCQKPKKCTIGMLVANDEAALYEQIAEQLANSKLDELVVDGATTTTTDLLEMQLEADKCKKKKDGKCKKFPYVPCDAEKKPKSEPDCPPLKIKKRVIKDCPANKEKCKKTAPTMEDPTLSDEEENVLVCKKKKECPSVDLNTADIEEKPCPSNKKENTKTCPGDLLKKKERPSKKKTAGNNYTHTEEVLIVQ